MAAAANKNYKLEKLDPQNSPAPVIFGLSGTSLTKKESDFFKDANPLGFILFDRNCKSVEQVQNLTNSLHDMLGHSVPILIDQEGGRVQRLKPPVWNDYHSPNYFTETFRVDFKKGSKALSDQTQTIAKDLKHIGISINCAPVMDVVFDETHDIISSRAFSSEPQITAALASTVCNHYLKNGIIPVVKHLPGHGRATLDSHEDLPVIYASVEEMKETDFVPYKELQTKPYSEAVWGMVAHIIIDEVDNQAPASCSRRVIHDVIRETIGFGNLLLSDAIEMNALSMYGDMAYRAEKCLRSGCDIALHCDGNLDDMVAIAKRIPAMTDEACKRYNKSIAWLNRNYK
jgi:beta-N-acetylhexosaminidase